MSADKPVQILCYGDSNTWGTIGEWVKPTLPTKRYAPENRWPCVLQERLGAKVNVIAEGLGGRTTIYKRYGEEWKCGETYLLPCLRSHRPLDLVIIMLGTNDLQVKKDITADVPLKILLVMYCQMEKMCIIPKSFRLLLISRTE